MTDTSGFPMITIPSIFCNLKKRNVLKSQIVIRCLHPPTNIYSGQNTRCTFLYFVCIYLVLIVMPRFSKRSSCKASLNSPFSGEKMLDKEAEIFYLLRDNEPCSWNDPPCGIHITVFSFMHHSCPTSCNNAPRPGTRNSGRGIDSSLPVRSNKKLILPIFFFTVQYHRGALRSVSILYRRWCWGKKVDSVINSPHKHIVKHEFYRDVQTYLKGAKGHTDLLRIFILYATFQQNMK